MPLIVFGDGLKGGNHTKYKGLRVGASEKIYKNLKRRESLGELFLLDIDEFRTSSVNLCNSTLLGLLMMLFCKRFVYTASRGTSETIELRMLLSLIYLFATIVIYFGTETSLLLKI